jgi:hypothetical protein
MLLSNPLKSCKTVHAKKVSHGIRDGKITSICVKKFSAYTRTCNFFAYIFGNLSTDSKSALNSEFIDTHADV